MIGRRNFLQLAGRAAAPPSASSPPARDARQGNLRRNPRGAAGGRSHDGPGTTAGSGGLTPVASDSTHRSSASGTQLRAGWSPLRPTGVRCCGKKAPLVLMLHGAGGDARSGISDVLDLADEAGLILLAPESRGRSWDVLVGGYGPDVVFIDRSLGQTFDRLAVDAEKVAVVGFSDGASYALSLGPTNGDLFTRVIAFSPGFASPGARRGMPPVFVSHGTRDGVSLSSAAAEGSCRGWSARVTRSATGSSTALTPCRGRSRAIAREALGWVVAYYGTADAGAPSEAL